MKYRVVDRFDAPFKQVYAVQHRSLFGWRDVAIFSHEDLAIDEARKRAGLPSEWSIKGCRRVWP